MTHESSQQPVVQHKYKHHVGTTNFKSCELNEMIERDVLKATVFDQNWFE